MQQQLDWLHAQKLRDKVRKLVVAPVFSARGTRVWRLHVGGYLACAADREHIGIGQVAKWYRFWSNSPWHTSLSTGPINGPHILHQVPRAVAWAYFRETALTVREWWGRP